MLLLHPLVIADGVLWDPAQQGIKNTLACGLLQFASLKIIYSFSGRRLNSSNAPPHNTSAPHVPLHARHATPPPNRPNSYLYIYLPPFFFARLSDSYSFPPCFTRMKPGFWKGCERTTNSVEHEPVSPKTNLEEKKTAEKLDAAVFSRTQQWSSATREPKARREAS